MLKVYRFLMISLILSFLILGCAAKKEVLLPSEEVVKGKVITRGKFAYLLTTGLNWEGIEKRPKKVIIIDISQNPYRNEIKKVAKMEIMEVYPNHTFLPDKTLNRGECAKIVENILVTIKGKEKWRKKYLGKPSPFPDVPNYHRHFNAIMLATKKNTMKPYRDGRFRPGLPLSPGEARRVIRRLERHFK
ncbi:S-layer homology domain-containing protein [bacterium]|nr:S-layer homology domain-containing protein [bacterium]MBU4561010.1 S-layer homology domain-containing protein [bacterium]MCG2676865.1 S-layer homology domain-containing protein [bacterium]MCG2677602.1 S-layer homology domain-containing protein [bacterium]